MNSFSDMAQVHQDFIGKCSVKRLAGILDIFQKVQEDMKNQGIQRVITFTKNPNPKLLKYWELMGLDLSVSEVDGITYGSKEL